MSAIRFSIALFVLGSLAACEQATTPAVSQNSSPAVEGCVRDVTAMTNNSVAVVSAFESEAGTEVMLGVGPDMAPWKCIGYSDGTTAGIMSLADEGAL